MSEKTQKRREELRHRLIEAATVRIARDGARTLRARDLAADAGCSVGAIYNVFEDLTALVMAVNGQTFLEIGRQVAAVSDAKLSSSDQLTQLSFAYLNFARQNTGLWRALFDLETGQGADVPEWYVAALDQLFSHINGPVSQMFPELDGAGVGLMTRTLFSAVHGIVSLGLENRLSSVPEDQIENMIAALLGSLDRKK